MPTFNLVLLVAPPTSPKPRAHVRRGSPPCSGTSKSSSLLPSSCMHPSLCTHPSKWASPNPDLKAPPALYDIETAVVAAVSALAPVPFPTTKMKAFIKHSLPSMPWCSGPSSFAEGPFSRFVFMTEEEILLSAAPLEASPVFRNIALGFYDAVSMRVPFALPTPPTVAGKSRIHSASLKLLV
ncbi:hypothetical protein R3P38DRAFT_3164410 [Favolaschia claudopus]|uniref:Uncharacterized protein n=1 Tax=Favolaschia claudopus TaxID=2862362 RepID=A0AAW0EFB1_9AGAR